MIRTPIVRQSTSLTQPEADAVRDAPTVEPLASRSRFDRIVDQSERRPGVWLAGFAFLLAIQISPWWYPSGDSCIYMSLARNIAEGDGFEFLGVRGVGLPPGYSLMIAPAYLTGARPILALSILSWCFAVVAMLGVFVWARRLSPRWAVLITSVTMLNAGLWFQYRRTLKEVAFLAVLIWSVNACRWLQNAKRKRELIVRGTVAALLTGSLVLVRFSGVVVVAAFAAVMLLEARRNRGASWRRAAGVATVVGVGAVALLVGLLMNGSSQYLQGFYAPEHFGKGASRNFILRFVEGLRMRISDTGRLLAPGMFKTYPDAGEWLDVNMFIYITIAAVTVFGWWRFCRRQQLDVLLLTLPLFVVLYAAWPFDQGGRFMVPMLPALAACFWCGLMEVVRRPGPIAVWLPAAHLAAAIGYWAAVDMPRAIALDPRWGEVESICQRIDNDERFVAAVGVSNFDVQLAVITLDRQVALFEADGIRPKTKWLIEPVDENVQPEFSPVHSTPHLRLSRRTEGSTNVARRRTSSLQ